MAWDDNLEGVHRDIAAEARTPIHVLAGPGTGKTFAMMRRIARLLEDGVEAERILAVTFTRTAARDLRDQLGRLGVEGSDAVRATTLHSLCFGALSQEEVFAATGRAARPLLSYEIKQLISDLAGGFGGKRNVKLLLAAYEAAWARMQNEEAGLPQAAVDVAFQAALLDWLRYHRSMLIGELVPVALRFVIDNPAITIFPEFDHVLVDEYQDLNRSDQELISRLSPDGTLTVIGDDNQSIYSFRYANPEGIRDFQRDVPGTIPYIINECRRCPPNIVEMSNSLIANDMRRARPVPLQPVQGRNNSTVYIVQHDSVDAEVQSIADFVQNYLAVNQGLPQGQVLVLATRRFIGNGIRSALIQRGLNSLSYFYEDELEELSAAEGFCVLKLLVDPDDRAALRAWLGMASSDGRSAGYDRIRQYAQREGIEPRQVLADLAERRISIPYSSGILQRYTLLQQRLQSVAGLEGIELVRSLWDVADESILDTRLLAERIALDNPAPADLLDNLTTAITQPELPGSDGDIVRVMSLHKSKGLTASLVVVAGCVAGALPSIKSGQGYPSVEAQFDEQRRLFYVAITRATDTLVISSSARMQLRDAMGGGIAVAQTLPGGMVRTTATPYVSELGNMAPRTINTTEWRRRAGF